MSLGMAGGYGDSGAAGAVRRRRDRFPRVQVDAPAVRPDDVADRFAHSDVAVAPEPTNGSGWRIEWDDAVTSASARSFSPSPSGSLGSLRRPRIAGL